MRSVTPAAAVLVALTACAMQAAQTDSRPAVAHVTVEDLPVQPPHLDTGVDPSPALIADDHDPVAVALGTVVHRLRRSGFDIADLGAEPVEITPGLATVRVAVHQITRTGEDRIWVVVYDCALRREPDGRWVVVATRQVA